MLIIDYSQICISVLFAIDPKDIDEKYLRHVFLNSLRKIRKQFRNDGPFVLAIDSTNIWRKDVFPYYKAMRKETRDKSNINWNEVYAIMGALKEDLKKHFGYIVIETNKAEADDVISSLCQEYGNLDINMGEKIVIVSRDTDFVQLHKYLNVSQYDPIGEKWVEGNPEVSRFTQVIKGSSKDGVPNIFSAPDCFITKTRQKAVSTKKLDEWRVMDEAARMSLFTDMGVYKEYLRNEKINDLMNTPDYIKKDVIEQFNKGPTEINNLDNYFIKHQLKSLFETINDFY